MSGKAVDSFGVHTRTSAQALAAAGVQTAARYHYNATPGEVATLHAAGVAFLLICEFDTATWHPPLHNPEVGPQHGASGVKAARALGLPAGCALAFTQDTYIPAGKRDAAVSYFAGAAAPVRSAGYRVMGYGDADLMELCLERGAIDLIWQAGADSWSQGRLAPHAVLWQRVGSPVYGGVTCDPNIVLAEDHGQWLPDGTAAGPSTGPTPQPQTIEGADVQTIIAIETKQGHYIFEPGIGTGRVITPEESQLLQDNGWKVRTYPAGSFAHVVLNEKVNRLNYTEVG